jgi:AAA+ superfamily predicted ATPase
MKNLVETTLHYAFSNSLEHLFAEVKRIELKLQLQAVQAHSRDNLWDKEELRGLYISEKEISAIVGKNSGLSLDPDSDVPNKSLYENISRNLALLEEQIESQEKESLNQGTLLRLVQLVSLFALTAFDKDVLLLSLLPELDLRNERLFGYIQDDVTRRRPAVGLALTMLCSSLRDEIESRRFFLSQSPLLKYKLISLHDETPRKSASLLARSIKIDDRICEYLLGSNEIEHALIPFTRMLTPQTTLDDIVLPHDMKDSLVRLLASHWSSSHHLTLYFYGAKGSGRQSTAEALCRKLGSNKMLYADTNLMLVASLPFETMVRLLHREAMLQDAPVYWDNFDALFADSLSTQLKIAITEMVHHGGVIFIAGNKAWNTACRWNNRLFIPVEFPEPDYSQRKQLWQSCLNGQEGMPEALVTELAGKFQLNGGQIRGAVSLAQNLSVWRDGGVITREELYRACRQKSNQKLTELARKIEPRYVWDDIVLPRDQLGQLKEICSYVKYHDLVYVKWGFAQKSALGKGINALFTGPSGTGKTMAAEIIANELGIDLYKIDLATVVSKYIGETEKNLDKIFKEAQDSNSILFFDEADAIFGKRSEVRDSHDRYANIEIAYLLQKMEEYQGMVILATNFGKNLDEAFARRMHFSIEFPFPEEEGRYLIWQKAFPKVAPLAEDIDLAFLARQFRITGGNIKNIVLSGAFLAAEDSHAITMGHLILAARREFQKMGKLCTEADFAHYFELVKG